MDLSRNLAISTILTVSTGKVSMCEARWVLKIELVKAETHLQGILKCPYLLPITVT